jgi:hypothetical protein
MRPNMPIEDILTGKGQLLKQKLAEREHRLHQRDQALRAVSRVNPTSEKIVQNRYILQGETTGPPQGGHRNCAHKAAAIN